MQTTTDIHWNKGEISQEHNERDEELCKNESHIDYYNEHGQSYYETWYHSELKDKYQEIFGDAIDNFNAKQKRKDRMIDVDSYMQSVKNDTRGKRQTKKVNGKKVADENARHGKQLSYEFTVKIGNTYRAHDKNGRTCYDANNHHIRHEELPRDLQKQILRRYCDTFQVSNPNLRLVNVNYHADEGFYNRRGQWEYSETHAHVEIIPVANGFKQGLSIQNSMNKAMKAMGFDTSDCYELWAKKEQARLEEITLQEYQAYCATHTQFAQSHGDLTFYHPVADKTRNGDMSKEQLAHEQELDEIIHEANYLKRFYAVGCKNVDEQKADLQSKIDAQKKLNEELQNNINKAKEDAFKSLQARQAAEQQKKAYEDAKAVYDKAASYNQQNAPTSFETWAKGVNYKCVKMKMVQRINASGTGYEYIKAPDRTTDGKLQFENVNPYTHYQQIMARKQGYRFTQADRDAIDKANRYDDERSL